MKSRLALVGLGILSCLSSSGQTNACSSTNLAFCLPRLRLTTEARPEVLSACLDDASGRDAAFARAAIGDQSRFGLGAAFSQRALGPEEHVSVSEQPALPPPGEFTEVDLVFGDADLHARVLRRDHFYLTRPEPRSDDLLVRAVEGIFTPEVVHVGKIPISCSLITAIKRKNPLCLLNPIFFQASW